MSRHALFVYGTLLFPEIMRRVVGRVLPSRPATLRGWARRGIEGERYPGVFPLLGESVAGRLFSGVDGATLRRLDVYEGAEFERRWVHVHTERGRSGAFVYALTAAARSTATKTWHVQDFGVTRTRNG